LVLFLFLEVGPCVPVVPILARTAVSEGKSWQLSKSVRSVTSTVRLGHEDLRAMGFADAAAPVLLEEPVEDHALAAYSAVATSPDSDPPHGLPAHHAAEMIFVGGDIHSVVGFGARRGLAMGDTDDEAIHVHDDTVILVSTGGVG